MQNSIVASQGAATGVHPLLLGCGISSLEFVDTVRRREACNEWRAKNKTRGEKE
jgi:hypothetical protein